MKPQKLLFLFPLLAFPAAKFLFGYSAGPLPRHTAGFREQSCHQCHSSYRVDEGRTIGGVFDIRGVPKSYEPGHVYPITVIIGQPGQSRWGFELSVRHASSGKQAGILTALDPTTQIKEESGVQYVEHTSAGTRRGTADGPVEFLFNWTAPDTSGGPVFFNASGNAADGSDTPLGDYVYTAGAYSAAPGAAGNIPTAKPGRAEGTHKPGLAETSKIAALPASVDLNKGSVEIHVQHRFFQSISDSTPGNAFGIDYGANINLGVNYAFTDRLSAGVSRARLDQIVNFSGTYELMTRRDSFWKMSLLAGIEGKENFTRQFSPFVQLASSFDLKVLRLHAVPTIVFNSRDDRLVDAAPALAINPTSNHTFSLGLGADLALTERFSLIGEAVPRLAGFGGFVRRQPEFSGGLEIRTPAHVFTILVSSSREFGPSKYAVNAENRNVSLGFNIYRRIK
jgi:hypothetical protein